MSFPELPLTNTSNQQEITRALPLAMIQYISCSHRVLFPDKAENWQEFHESNRNNFEKYSDLTPMELSEEFVNNVLPRIYDFELTPYQRKSFALLRLNTEYRSVDQGFQRVAKPERLLACREPRLNIDYCVRSPTFQPPVSPNRDRERFLLTPDLQNIHTVVSSAPRQVQTAGSGFQFNPSFHALFSAVLSDDFELSGCVLFEPKELHQRMRNAKLNFEQRALMPQNFLNSSNLILKMQNWYKLRRNLARVLDESFN